VPLCIARKLIDADVRRACYGASLIGTSSDAPPPQLRPRSGHADPGWFHAEVTDVEVDSPTARIVQSPTAVSVM
jgi:hypothetical protein